MTLPVNPGPEPFGPIPAVPFRRLPSPDPDTPPDDPDDDSVEDDDDADTPRNQAKRSC
jgi:hypothetical protein